MSFQLHPQLEKDLLTLAELKFSKLMVMPDSKNPWIILVPRIAGVTEFFQLTESDQLKLTNEINKLSAYMFNKFQADKMNIGMLGNMVPQLHIHIICRYKSDRAWPGAIWGTSLEKEEIKFNEICNNIREFIEKEGL